MYFFLTVPSTTYSICEIRAEILFTKQFTRLIPRRNVYGRSSNSGSGCNRDGPVIYSSFVKYTTLYTKNQ